MNASAYIRPSQHPLAAALLLGLGLTPLVGVAATISVTTTGDAGDAGTCTVRQAITSMNNAALTGTNCVNSGAAFGTSNTINFDTTTFPVGGANTISLADAGSSTLAITGSNLTIDASANGQVTIQRPSGAANNFGIMNATGTLVLNNLTLSNGNASGGGGIFFHNGNITLNNSTLSGNTGSGIWAQFASITLNDSTLSGNTALQGGGISANSSGVTVNSSTLSGNSAYDGGGIFLQGSSVTLTKSTLSANSAAGGSGGGISAFTGDVTLTQSTLSGNSAKWGGGIFDNSGVVTLTNSTLTANSASASGGGVYDSGGGGVQIVLTNSTVAANSGGGGIYRNDSFHLYSNIKVVNSIVAANAGGDINVGQTGDSSGNIIGGDPQLGALADNGGPTQTMLPQATSPVIDAIACTNAPATDQRGVPRPQGGQCDIGAVEVGHPFSLAVDTTADTQVADGKCSLREAIAIFTQGRTGSDCPASASVNNQILFAPALAGSNITVGSPMALNNNVEVTIDGSAAPGLAIDGGAATFIFNESAGSTVTIQHLQMVNGSSAGSDGGAIDNAGTLTLIDTALNNNTSNTGGGAINNLGTLNIDHSTLSNNLSSGSGGAISAQAGVSNVTESTITDNLAGAGGGVFLAAGGTLNLFGSNVSTNHAFNTSGGGVAGNGHFTVANSTFSGNTAAGDGGAIYNNKSSNTNKVVNSTLVGNTASANGGNLANAAGTLLLQNSIVANSGGGGNCQGVITPGTGFMTWPASDTTCGVVATGDPVLGPLQNNGGPTFTMLPGVGSALINAGNNATCASAPVSNRDQRGGLRPQGAACDIGAVEVVMDRIFGDNFDGIPTP